MPFNGSGGFTPLAAPDYPAVAGEIIYADRFNNNIDDIHGGLTNCLTKDGQSSPSANLPMNNFKFTGAAAGTATGQFMTYGQLLGAFSAGAGVAASLSIAGNGTTIGVTSFDLAQAVDSSVDIVNRSNARMSFYTNSLERMRITADGLFGFGATPTTYKAHFAFAGDTVNGLLLADTAAGGAPLAINVTKNAASVFSVSAAGGVTANAFVGPITGAVTGNVNGNVTGNLTGNVTGDVTGNLTGNVVGTVNGNTIASGTYTPTLTNIQNVSSSVAAVCQYLRVGNVVTVSGTFTADAVSGGGATTQVGISLPIASDFTANNQAGGALGGAIDQGFILADISNNYVQAQWASNTTVSVAMAFTFTYLIA